MNVVIDATTLLLRSAGVKNYLHYWLSALLEAAPGHGDTVCEYPPALGALAALDHEKSAMGSFGTLLRLSVVQFNNIRRNPAINLFLSGADLFHCSQHAANLPGRMKVTATVFDLSCWTTPEMHTPENVAATRRYGETTLKVADGLIAISEHARNDAAAILRIPEARIRVIYPGVAEPFFQTTPGQGERVRAKFALHAPFILFVGCIEPRKNVPGLIRAYQRLPEALRRDLQLVIAGPFGWASDDVRRMLTNSGAGVRYLGYVPEADLPGLFRGASGFAYPSYYEGFGLPVAQAMAVGVPVIVSDRSCLPEIAGDAGLCVDPDSEEALTNAIQRTVTDSEFAAEAVARGKARARKFHWPARALESLDFFREVMGNSA
jgi:glycosyltransferase involved in cell wall biosynthesis